MKTKLQVRVRYDTCVYRYEYTLYLGARYVLWRSPDWYTEKTATKKAKMFAKKCGVPFNSKIIRHQGC